jgi:hypothetical protein
MTIKSCNRNLAVVYLAVFIGLTAGVNQASAQNRDDSIAGPPAKDEKTESERKKTIAKMKAIKIPELDFRQANIEDVLKFLADQSRDFDTISKNDERKGVDIVLKLKTATAAATPVADDPFAVAVATGKTAAAGSEPPAITFTVRQISLFDALGLVTELADLKFRVRGRIVMVVRKDEPDDDIVDRRYDVSPKMIDKVRQYEGK